MGPPAGHRGRVRRILQLDRRIEASSRRANRCTPVEDQCTGCRPVLGGLHQAYEWAAWRPPDFCPPTPSLWADRIAERLREVIFPERPHIPARVLKFAEFGVPWCSGAGFQGKAPREGARWLSRLRLSLRLLLPGRAGDLWLAPSRAFDPSPLNWLYHLEHDEKPVRVDNDGQIVLALATAPRWLEDGTLETHCAKVRSADPLQSPRKARVGYCCSPSWGPPVLGQWHLAGTTIAHRLREKAGEGSGLVVGASGRRQGGGTGRADAADGDRPEAGGEGGGCYAPIVAKSRCKTG